MSETLNRAPSHAKWAAGRAVAAELFRPIDAASLAFFRVAFGGIMLWEVCRYFHYGWIERYYIEPQFHFTYFGFDWVRPWPAAGMYAHFVALGILSVGIACGFFYRLCAILFFLGFSYVFLLEQARYLNHFYLISLLGLLLIVVPAHRTFSLDALRNPAMRSETVAAWPLWLLRAQIGIAYFYGGLAKLNADWLRGEPMRMWLADRADFPLVGPLFEHEFAVWFFSYGGLLFDVLVVPLLLWRRTRAFAVAVAVVFHLMNFYLFHIGVFPWLMIAATLLFLPADWPRRLLRPSAATFASATQPAPKRPEPRQRLTLALLGGYLAVQVLLPMRHFLYPGNVSWTEEGHRFAWHMKLRSKWAESRFFGRNPATGEMWEFDVSRHLPLWQYAKMSARPDMILQFGRYLADEYRREYGTSIEVVAVVWASLNGRRPSLLIDPQFNLAETDRSLLPASWILPPAPGAGHYPVERDSQEMTSAPP